MAMASPSRQHTEARQQTEVASLLHAIMGRLDALGARLDDVPTNDALEAVAERCEAAIALAATSAVAAAQKQVVQERERAAAEASERALHDAAAMGVLRQAGVLRTRRAGVGAATALVILAGLIHHRSRRRLNGAVRKLPLRLLLLVQLITALLLSTSHAFETVRAHFAELPLASLLFGPSPLKPLILSERSRQGALACMGVVTVLLPWRIGLKLV